SHFVAAQRFGQDLPLPRRINVEGRIFFDLTVEQQVPVKMPDGRELSSHRTAVERIGKQFLEELPNILPPRTGQILLSILQKLRKLSEVAGVSGDRQLRRSALHSQVVEESGERPGIGVGGHGASIEWRDELAK